MDLVRWQDMYRRIRLIESDSKADPNVVENTKRNRDMFEVRGTKKRVRPHLNDWPSSQGGFGL